MLDQHTDWLLNKQAVMLLYLWDSSNNIGIGTSDPEEILHVAAASEAVGNRDGVMFQSTSALAADTGLPLVFTSHIGTQANYGVASIAGRKENATSGQAGGYLQFATGNAAGAISEKVRIDSAGKLLVNLTSARTKYFNTTAYGALVNFESTSNSNRIVSFSFIMTAAADQCLS